MINLILHLMENGTLKTAFLKLANMSISASWLVLAILVLRLVLKKAPKWVNVLLWGIVAVRLICPFSIESALSLIPSTQTIPMNIEMATNPAIDSGINAVNSMVNPIISASFTPHPGASANPLQIWIPLAAVIWFFGMVLMFLYTAISYWRLNRRIDAAVLYRDNIFQTANVSSPFVLGIIKPKIYLPFHMNEQDIQHVVAHEQAHIRRKDHWWKPLGFLLLTVYWFNPLMWVAYILLCRDIELACDEKVIADLGNDQRADYTQALVACSINRRMLTACPLAFGEVGVKDRVKSIMNYRKPAFWIVVTALVLCVVVAVCFLTNPLEDSWIKVTQGAASVELECNFVSPINAYAIYEDIYESGELVSSEAIVFDNFQNEGGATPRRTTLSLSVQPVNSVGRDGYTGELSVNFGGSGIAYMTRKLPKDYYTDYVHVVTETGNRIFKKQTITTEDNLTLYSIVLSTDLLGIDHKSLVARVRNNTLPQSKDTVVIYRLVTSENKELNRYSSSSYDGNEDLTNNSVYGKTYLYDRESSLGSFTITLYDDNTFTYYEGMASSYLGMGRWSQEGDIITLTDDNKSGYGLINHFRLEGEDLVFSEEDSTNFIYIKVRNGDEFHWTGEAFKPTSEVDEQVQRGDSKNLSLNDVIILSQKGYDLTWSDFEQFEYIETGFGLYIRRYEINDQFHFAIGGAGPNSEPMYMHLGANGDDPEAYIDIREGGVTEFIEQQKTDSAEIYDRIPMVMVDGVLYLDTGKESTAMARCGMMDGEITSQVDGSKAPTIDDQSNFGTGFGYQYGAIEGTIEIYMNGKWWIFATEEVRQEIQFPTEGTDMELMIDPIVPVTVVDLITGEQKFVNSNPSIRAIQSLIASEWWAEGNPSCDYDFKITVNEVDVLYHTDCGTFTDVLGDRCITLDESQKEIMNELLSVAQNDVLDRYWLTIGADGVKRIEIKTAYFSGGCENADGSLYKKGDRIWVECLEGFLDLRGVSFTAMAEDGQIIWQASIPDGENNAGFTHLRNNDWNITNIP